MSVSGLSNVLSFNVASVFAHCDLRPHQKMIERAAVQAVYNSIAAQPIPPLQQEEYPGLYALRHTIARLDSRLKTINRFEKSFFHHGLDNHDALVVAILCGEILHKDEHGKYDPALNDIDLETVKQARKIYAAACVYVVYGLSKEEKEEDINMEAFFTATVIALEEIDTIWDEIGTGAKSKLDLTSFVCDRFVEYQTFSNASKPISEFLSSRMYQIWENLPKPKQAKNGGPEPGLVLMK